MKLELIGDAVRVAPPVAVSSASLFGWHVSEMAYALTIIYTALMLAHFLATKVWPPIAIRFRARRALDEIIADRPSNKERGAANRVVVGGLVLASAGLMAFVGMWESGPARVLTVYPDKLAGGLPTVCHGLTRHVTKTPIVVGERWTDAKCEAEEQAAMRNHVQLPLLRCFNHAPPQSVFDAASEHAWNMGVAQTCGSVAMQHWNRRSYATGCQRLAYAADGRPVWAYAGGKFYRGLHNRRKASIDLCMKDVR